MYIGYIINGTMLSISPLTTYCSWSIPIYIPAMFADQRLPGLGGLTTAVTRDPVTVNVLGMPFFFFLCRNSIF
jgi:hypothetical protein